ncbi:MAG: hypothetical protein AMK71_01185 [Nitrospira bacterium SG8_35_4]|nr:MAG: hypothetical protein AMK71_01185 [Nitrospira bacterium SG8_35_4]
MKCIKNDVVTCYCNESSDLQTSIERLAGLFRRNPSLLEPFRHVSSEVEDHFKAEGFQIYPTVKKTTLLYDPASDCFLKVLHPLTLKHRVQFAVMTRSKAIYKTAEFLFSKGVPVQRVEAYGTLTPGSRPFFGIKRADGDSLYDIFIRQKQTMNMDHCRAVIGEISKVHALGFWLGDAHLSHIFVKDGKVSGIIDIDSVRRNRPFLLKNPAKDLAGLNHPDLPLSRDDKNSLMDHYLIQSGIREKDKFIRLLKYYTERRWKD